MYPRNTILSQSALLMAILMMAIAALMPDAAVNAAPQPQIVTVELFATQDARIQAGSPDNGFGNGLIWVGTPEGHLGLVEFDLSILPVNATIDSAELQLNFTGVYTPTANVEVGRNDGPWDEATITWNTRPATTFGGPVQTIGDAPSVVSWDVTSTVAQWVTGSLPNYGFALRGDGPLKSFRSKESNATLMPKLVVIYSNREDDVTYPRPDVGDAPDSTNHHGQPNTAYPVAGILGQFPTVYDVPANQPAGPLHRNETGEGILGQYISREHEADDGPDQDGLNNIIRDAGGAILNMANNDRGDDGWRNRNIKFFDCRERTLTIRVFKAPNATLKKMYLNVWFDGNRDGDWADVAPCEDPSGGPAEASYEWIVQDYIVDMSAINPGDYLDFDIDTELVHNSTPALPHWMRFTLSEERAIQPPNGDYPDGRGPHPNSAQSSFKYGETEDIFQKPPLGGEDGELILEKRVITDGELVEYAGSVTYQIRLRHDGGTQPIEARIRDELPYPLHVNRQIDDDGNVYLIDVSSPTSGASPLTAELNYLFGSNGSVTQEINWEGTLEPDAEIILSFEVHIHPVCGANENTTTIINLAQAQIRDESPISEEASFEAACPGYTPISIEIGESIINPIDPSDWTHFSWNAEIQNSHQNDIAIGFVQQNDRDRRETEEGQDRGDDNGGNSAAASAATTGDLRFIKRIELTTGEKKSVSLSLLMDELMDSDLTAPDDAPLGKLLFCILSGERDICPDPVEFPNWWGEIELPQVPRRADLGDAPDSTNHDGVGMAAYPAIPANFPTVFDPATGLPPGPRHLRPWLLHLGPNVSNEVEADRGPDADGVHNIVPLANTPNQDWFDDGSALTLQGQCEPAMADVEINVSAQAQQHFSATKSMAYLNIWLDWSYDGDWDDLNTCTGPGGQSTNVVEHILIDYPIDVAKMPVGTTTITDIVTSRVPWPAQFNEMERWVRFTLSNQPSNKTLAYLGDQDEEIKYGDGRGYPTPFGTGETEDYLWDLREDGVIGPDINIHFEGDIHLEKPTGTPNEEPRQVLDFEVNYANIGSQAAADALLTLTKSDSIRNVEILAMGGQGIKRGDATNSHHKITVPLPPIAAGASKSVMIRVGPVADDQLSAAAQMVADLEVTAQITVAGDLNESNNSATIVVEQPKAPIQLVGRVAGDNIPRKADASCRGAIIVASRGEPLAPANLSVNGVSNLQLAYDANGGIGNTEVTGLSDGRNLLSMDYPGSFTSISNVMKASSIKLLVDPSLTVDPITLLITDSQGRQHHPSTLNWSAGSLDSYLMQLRSGESYNISIDSCISDPNLNAELLLNNERLTTLRDDDGDGRFTGSFIYTSIGSGKGEVRAAGDNESSQLRLVIKANGVEQSIAGQIEEVKDGTVIDAARGEPVEGATVTALLDGVVATLTDANPQMTDASGRYSMVVPQEGYQLEVSADGYQPYRSGTLDASNGLLAEDVRLTPTIDEPANHTVYITAQGFSPESVNAKPGDVIAWINADLDEHAVSVDGWTSGHLASLGSYKIQLSDEGTYAYLDDTVSLAGTGIITVASSSDDPSGETSGDGDESDNENSDDDEAPLGSEVEVIFLPLVQ